MIICLNKPPWGEGGDSGGGWVPGEGGRNNLKCFPFEGRDIEDGDWCLDSSILCLKWV